MPETEDWSNMLAFALELAKHGKSHKDGDIVSQRIAIIHLDHATELLMKAYLLKEKLIKINDILNFKILIKRISDNGVNLEMIKQSLIDFHEIRNDIQHMPLNISYDKPEEIDEFLPKLNELYEILFPKDPTWFRFLHGKI